MSPIPGKRYFIRYDVATYSLGNPTLREKEIDSRVCASADAVCGIFRSGYSAAYISILHDNILSEDTRTWWQRMTT